MNYQDFYQQSINNPDAFWAKEAQRIDWHQPFTQVVDYSRPPFAKWFVGGETNLCHNAIDRWVETQGDQTALIAISTETPDGTPAEKTWTFRELQQEVERTAAIMLSAFEGYGIQTGPQLFSQQGGLVWTLIASLYIGNVILLVLNLPLVSLWVKLLKIPPPWLYAGIIVISTAGVYGAGNSVFNVGLLFVFGLLGYIMRRFDFPAAPLIVGLILAPLGEQSMRQALTISQGDWSTFFTRPLSGSLMAVSVLLLVAPAIWRQIRRS